MAKTDKMIINDITTLDFETTEEGRKGFLDEFIRFHNIIKGWMKPYIGKYNRKYSRDVVKFFGYDNVRYMEHVEIGKTLVSHVRIRFRVSCDQSEKYFERNPFIYVDAYYKTNEQLAADIQLMCDAIYKSPDDEEDVLFERDTLIYPDGHVPADDPSNP